VLTIFLNGPETVFLLLLWPSAKGFVRLFATMNTTIDINAGQNGNLTVEYEAYPKPKEEVWTYMNETLQNSSDHYVKFKTAGNNR